jgi:hypothetical protein
MSSKLGRQKGAKNTIGATAKENVIAVFTRLGGTAEMAKWAKANQTDFYRLYAKLIPQQIDLEITERPIDVAANPLPADEWDERYSAGKPN